MANSLFLLLTVETPYDHLQGNFTPLCRVEVLSIVADISPVPTIQSVIPSTAKEKIVLAVTKKSVIPTTAKERISPGTTAEHIIPPFAKEGVRPRVPKYPIIATPTQNGIVPRTAANHIVTAKPIDNVIAPEPDDNVIAPSTSDRFALVRANNGGLQPATDGGLVTSITPRGGKIHAIARL
jgi:hypothetical protein